MRRIVFVVAVLSALWPARAAFADSLDFPRLPHPASPARTASSAAAGPTVGQALDRLLHAGAISRREHDARRDDYRAAMRTAGGLRGGRRVELRAVLGRVDSIAARGLLTASRVRALFLTLRVNRRWWATRPAPGPRERVSLSGSRLVWQYYPGEGIQLQMLASWGKANGLWQGHFDPGLHALIGELIPLAAERAGGLAWESYFGWQGGVPPWASGMTQGTAVQALARAARRLHEPHYLKLAHRALGPMATRAPAGVRVPASGGGAHYLIYSFAPRMHVLNGFVQSLNGLHDYAAISGDDRGRRLFASGEREARREVPRYDTGAWSYYVPGSESSLSYHELVRDFLSGLCTRTGVAVYCRTARRFTAYMKQPPRLAIARPAARERRAARLGFRLSKISSVTLSVRRGGHIVLLRRALLARGAHAFVWASPRRGRYEVRVDARDLAGNGATATRRLAVAPAP